MNNSRTESGPRKTHALTGPAAIERYLQAEEKGRLIQSLKSHLSSRSLTGTEVFGRRYKLEDLIARMLGDLRKHAEKQFERPIRYAMVGRPVRFVGAETPEDDDFAVARLREAFAAAGFERVDFEMEPVAAACAYESHTRPRRIDSDWRLWRRHQRFFAASRRPRCAPPRTHSARICSATAAWGLPETPSTRASFASSSHPRWDQTLRRARSIKLLPAVPAWIYANLERWHYLSFLRTNNVREILKSARIRALEPEKIQALITLIEEDLGYQLHQAVQRVKFELSRSDRCRISLSRRQHGPAHPGHAPRI